MEDKTRRYKHFIDQELKFQEHHFLSAMMDGYIWSATENQLEKLIAQARIGCSNEVTIGFLGYLKNEIFNAEYSNKRQFDTLECFGKVEDYYIKRYEAEYRDLLKCKFEAEKEYAGKLLSTFEKKNAYGECISRFNRVIAAKVRDDLDEINRG